MKSWMLALTFEAKKFNKDVNIKYSKLAGARGDSCFYPINVAVEKDIRRISAWLWNEGLKHFSNHCILDCKGICYKFQLNVIKNHQHFTRVST